MEMFLAPLPMLYIFRGLFVLGECVLMLMPSTTETDFRLLCYSALFVFLVSHVCCVALPYEAMGLSEFVIVVFPDHTHLILLK